MIIAFLALLVHWIAGLLHWVHTYDYEKNGWLSNWIAGVGQAVGAIFTAGAVWVALRAERKTEKQRVQNRARLVSVQAPGHDRDGYQAIPEVRLRNDSLEPIFKAGVVSVCVVDSRVIPGHVIDHRTMAISGGGPGGAGYWIDVIKPQSVIVFHVRDDGSVPNTSPEWPKGQVQAVIQFIDPDGQAWERTNDQLPRKIKHVEWELHWD